MKISFLGTGNVANSLGKLFAEAGHSVLYGSRTPSGTQVGIKEAIVQGQIICLAIPYSAVKDICGPYYEELSGKTIVDITNPIHSEDWSPIFLGESSAAEEIAQLLPKSKIVKAFNTIFADVMSPSKQVFNDSPLTTFIASDDTSASERIAELAEDAGFTSVVAPGLKNARYLEAMAHLNIAMALSGKGTDVGFIYSQRG